MASSLLLASILPILFLAILWLLPTSFLPTPPRTLLSNKRIILLIAHPDDESMFFSPTLQALTATDLGNHLKILCLSTGNESGLGDTRKKEIEKAALTLGVRRREDVFVLEDERFQDGFGNEWAPEEIAKVLAQAFAPQLVQGNGTVTQDKEKDRGAKAKSTNTSKRKSTTTGGKEAGSPTLVPEGPRATIDVLITFDNNGISGHPNHIALYHGAKQFVSNIMKGHSGYACPVTLYTLPSVNMVRKYSFILDVVPTMLAGIFEHILSGKKKATKDDRVIFVNDFAKYWKAREAMTDGHKSQMVWFRWGWIGLGRYMVVNDLKKERVIAT